MNAPAPDAPLSFGFSAIDTPDGAVLAVLRDGRVVTLENLVTGGTVTPAGVAALLPQWDDWLAKVESALRSPASAEAGWQPAGLARFLPPLTHRPAVYCAGANYYDHVKEMGADPPEKNTQEPYHFLTPAGALTGHRAGVRRPPGMRRLDWEAELVAVIGRRAEQVPAGQALEHVAGYTVGNDLSCRDDRAMRTAPFGINWLLQKGFTGGKPTGPAVVPARYVSDPAGLRMRLTVNDVLRQESSTAQMIFTVAEQIAALSAVVPLEPGDLIYTGTPAGTAAAHNGAYLEPGDLIVAEIEGVGQLETTII